MSGVTAAMNYAAPGAPSWRTGGSYTTLNTQNAYIPVTARQTFVSPSALPPPPSYAPAPLPAQASSQQSPSSTNPPRASSPQSARPRTAWSPEVRDYVQRSFSPDNAIKGISREEIEVRLKQVITEAASSHTLNTVNWMEYPLPQQLIKDERHRALLTPITPSSYVSQAPPVNTSISYQSQPPPDTTLRKRKSSEMSVDVPEEPKSMPPWRVNNKPSGTLADRVSFASSEKRQRVDAGKQVSKSNASLESRKKRFEDVRSGSYSPTTIHSSRGISPEAEKTGPIVGRSQKLEKHYFRLTSAPNPDDVRPLEVLRKTLDHLKKKWRTDPNYGYICDQFKSLRQDLTVQHIKNEFTTEVYETHARIALEMADLGEYNQCQTQLRALYKQNLGGHPVEFKAYRILYFIHTCNRTDMNDLLSTLTPADKKEPAIKHALEVRSALALSNYHKFFKLYLVVPGMGAYLMDMFAERERLAALACICKSYKPDVRLRFVTEELGFESDEEAAQFILDHLKEGESELLREQDGQVRLQTTKIGQTFEEAKKGAFRHVDIKGQI